MQDDPATEDVAKPVATAGHLSLFDVQVELERDVASALDQKLHTFNPERFLQSVPGTQMLKHALADVTAGVAEWFAEINRGDAGAHNAQGVIISDEDPAHVAYLTIRTVLNKSHKNLSVVRLSTMICRAIRQERWLREFRKHNRNLFQRIEKDMKSRSNHSSFKTDVWAWAATKDGFHKPPMWTSEQTAGIGARLIEILVEKTGWYEMVTRRMERRTIRVLERTKTFRLFCDYWLQTADVKPDYLPTVIPPKDWDGWWGGGYHTDQLLPLRLVKTGDTDYLNKLDPKSPIVTTINNVQRVGWFVNRPVFETMQTAIQARMQIGKLPMQTEEARYEQRPENATQEELSAWRLRNIRMFEAVREAESNWLQVMQTQRLAAQFVDHKAFYYPHTLDFRGRAYPIVSMFNPQGTDVAKGLLMFEKGKPLSDRGWRWLCIHGANCWDNGLTKTSFDSRVHWVMSNGENIVRSAEHPLDFTWWSQAEEPWQFLAFCMEFADAHAKTNGRRHPEMFASHLPVGMDGTCNGLQHFSAMLRDPIGGEATNLTPGATPADIYQRVADVVMLELRHRAALGDGVARAWFEFGIDRKATKRQVMTLPYGSTPFSCLQYTRDWYNGKAATAGRPFSPEAERTAITYLSQLIWDSIGKVVVAARAAMDWLKKCSDAVGAKPVEWTVPTGFRVKQAYKEMKMRRVRTVLFGAAYRPKYAEETDAISVREQRNGISPNFVHSYDGAHMAMTVDALVAQGIDTFAFVHDNYLSLAEDADVMAATLRRTFVTLHSEPALDVLARQLREAGVQVPDPPQPGCLDLNEVMASPYFFA